jgi:hypothetical protein
MAYFVRTMHPSAWKGYSPTFAPHVLSEGRVGLPWQRRGPGGPMTSTPWCSSAATIAGTSGGPSSGGGTFSARAGSPDCAGRKNSSKPPGARRTSMRISSVSKV